VNKRPLTPREQGYLAYKRRCEAEARREFYERLEAEAHADVLSPDLRREIERINIQERL